MDLRLCNCENSKQVAVDWRGESRLIQSTHCLYGVGGPLILRHGFVTAGNVTSKRNHINRNSSASSSDVAPSNQMYHPAADLHQSTLHSTHITFHLAAQLLTCFIEFSTQKRLISCLIENVLHAGSLHNCAWSWKSNMLPMFADIRVS